MTLLDPAGHVHSNAARWPGRVALRFADGDVTYGQLSVAIRRAAAALRLGPGSLVRIGVPATFDGIAGMLALHHAGSVPYVVPGAAEPKVLGDAPEAMIVVPTSGSSAGGSRPVPLTLGNVTAAIDASTSRIGTGADDVWLLCLPLHHVGGLSVMWRSLAAGGSVLVMECFDAGLAAAALAGRATVASMVPTMLHRVLASGATFSGVRALLLGGGPASPTLVERGVAAGLPVLASYGMTEATSQVATIAPDEIEAGMGTVGRPLRGMEVTIGSGGEILVEGPAVFSGYLGEPPRVGPHHTGDIGRFDEAGRLVVAGRGDDVVVTGGENVHPAQVEAALEAHPGVAGVVVFGAPSEEWGMAVVAVVEGDVTGEALRSWARTRLAPHQVPKRIVVVSHLPTLPSGKADRDAVRREWGGMAVP